MTATTPTRQVPAPEVDFDLHGVVGVRLVDARPSDIARVTRQLGPIRRRLDREPDITVRFVDRIDASRLTYVGLDAGYDSAAFYVLRGKGNVPAKARIPLEEVGGRIEIVCERALPAVPVLLAVVNLTALAKGVLPLHASAFTTTTTTTTTSTTSTASTQRRGVLATGWAKGGKTELLLAFAARGAHYVGDEWVYLTPDGRLLGVPEPIRLWSWQLRQLAALRERLPPSARAGLLARDAAARTVSRAAGALDGARPAPGASVLRRLHPLLERQAFVQVPPATLFGEHAIDREGRLDELVLVQSWDAAAVQLEPVEPREVAERMAASLVAERSPLLALYQQFRYAFPSRSSPTVDAAEDLERDLLQAMATRVSRAHLLRHPYPVEIDELYDPVAGMLGCASDAAVLASEAASEAASRTVPE